MYYKVTLTTSGGLVQANLDEIKNYFSTNEHAYLCVEYGEAGGNCHVEGVIDYDTSKTSNVTRRMKSLYSRMELEFTPNSVRVRKVTHMSGAISYGSKELHEKGSLLLLRGWKQTWIDKQVKDNVKKMRYDKLCSKGTRLTSLSGAAVMHEWCLANNRVVNGKTDMCEVVRLMGDEKYLFGNVKFKSLYFDLCALFSDGHAAESGCLEALHFY